MSNSMNNENKKISPEKKVVIFLSLFLIISVLVTAGLVYYKNEIEYISSDVNNNKNPENIKEKYGISSLSETYDINDIEYNNITETYGDFIEEYNEYKITINYEQISGLKDTRIQTKINKEIKKEAESLYEYSFKNDKNINTVRINSYVSANYSNVLSIYLTREISYNDDRDYEYTQRGLNYNLATGEKITFEKLFTADANIKSIIAQAAYEELSYQYITNFDELYVDLDTVDYSDIESKVFKILNNYNKSGVQEFFFDIKNIYILDEDIYVYLPIKMADFYQQIAIYNRYKSHKNLYTGEFLKIKDIPCFIDASYNYYFKIEEPGENLLTSISAIIYNEEYSELVKPLYDHHIEELKTKYIEEAKNIKDNEPIIYTTLIDSYEDYGIINITTNEVRYLVNPDKFEETKKQKIYEFFINSYEQTYSPYVLPAEENYFSGYTDTRITYEYDVNSKNLLSKYVYVGSYDANTDEYTVIQDDWIY